MTNNGNNGSYEQKGWGPRQPTQSTPRPITGPTGPRQPAAPPPPKK